MVVAVTTTAANRIVRRRQYWYRGATATLAGGGGAPRFAWMRVVDCQVHLHSRTYFEAHVERVEPPWVERGNGGYIFRTAGGERNRIPSAYCEIELQLQRCAAHGIDTVISSMGGFNVNHLPVGRALELAMQLNEEHAARERAHPGRYYGLALVPMQDPHAAIEALDHAVRTLSLRGVCVCSDVNGESIATPARRPIYRRIDELGVPIFLHPTASVMGRSLTQYGDRHTLERVVDSSVAALDLIFSGVLDDHPSLRIVHPHLGDVLSYLAPRIGDEHARQPNGGVSERPLSEYLRMFHTDTAHLGRGALRLAAEVYGPGRLLYASDYPYRRAADGLALVRETVGAEAHDRVLHANAGALLGLGVARAPEPS